MELEQSAKGKYHHTIYSDEEIDALLDYFQCNGIELKPFLDRFDY